MISGMMNNLSDVINFIKLDSRHWFAIAVVSSIFTVLFVSVIYYQFTPDVLQHNWVVIVGFVSFGVCVLSWGTLFSRSLWGRHEQRRLVGRVRKALENLSRGERCFLSEFIARESKSAILYANDGVAGGLVRAGIVYQSADVKWGSGKKPFNLEPRVWDVLKANRELLEPELTVVEEEVVSERPL